MAITHGTVKRPLSRLSQQSANAAQNEPTPPPPTNPFTGRPMNIRQAGFVQALQNRPMMKPARPPKTWDVTTLPAGSEVLITRQYGMGDTLMLTPLFRAMAARGLVVDFATDPRYVPLFETNPNLRSVYPVDAPSAPLWQYDLAINLDESDEPPYGSDQNRIRHYGRIIGIDLDTPESRRLEYVSTDEEIAEAQTNLRILFAPYPMPDTLPALSRPLVAFVWHSNSRSRDWSTPTRLKALYELTKAGATVLLLGSNVVPVFDMPGVLNYSGTIDNLRYLAALLSVCDGVITPDTGTFHLAAAMNLPVLTYFGPFAPADRFSGAETALTVVNTAAASACPYAPCRAFECPFCDVDGQSPCLAPDWSVLRGWVAGLPVVDDDPFREAGEEAAAIPVGIEEVTAGGVPDSVAKPTRRRKVLGTPEIRAPL